MTLTYWSFIVAIVALIISIWARIEAYLTSTRQQKNERAKNVGEALVAAQALKNSISDYIDEFKLFLEESTPHLKEPFVHEFNSMLSELKDEYNIIWDFVRYFEKITMVFESGQNLKIETSAIEAKIARFNQRRNLVEFDIRGFNKLRSRKEIFR